MIEGRHKLIQLTAENIKRLKAVSFPMRDGMNVVGGDNGAGKSSVLDSLMFLFMGKKHPDPELLRRGEEKGFVEAETEHLIMKRTLTKKGGGSLTLRLKEGNRSAFSAPQAEIDELTRPICFDPVRFLRMNAKDQVNALRLLVGLDFSELDTKYRTNYDLRTEVGRDHKRLEAEVEAMPYDKSATQAIPLKPVQDKIANIESLQAMAIAAGTELSRAESAMTRYKDRLGELGRQREVLQKQLEDVLKSIETGNTLFLEQGKIVSKLRFDSEAKNKAVPNSVELMTELEKLRAHNQNVSQNELRAEKAKERDAKRREYDQLTSVVEGVEGDKKKMLAEAKFPIEGLSFDEDGVRFNDLPLSQASSAEQLRVAVAVSAAMNPAMPVMMIKEGSLLDDSSMDLVSELADEFDLQVVMERVEKDGYVTILITDGEAEDVIKVVPES